jgi:hypothetical protein
MTSQQFTDLAQSVSIIVLALTLILIGGRR